MTHRSNSFVSNNAVKVQ